MGRQSKLVLLLSVSVLATWASADDLSRKRLEADVRFLADDQLEGRGTPSRGLELAALYLATELRAAGWEPANEGSFLQEYALEEYSPAETRFLVKANGVTLRPDEYLLLPVYVGEELESPPDEPASPEAGMVGFLASTPSCGGTYAEWKTRLVDGASTRAMPVSATVELSVEARPKRGRSANVVAALRGSDPALRDEWVVLSGHYDHMGRVDVPGGQDGIFNGADDNASGVAAALEIARKLRGGPPPRRSVLVLLTSGEERGLLGAAHYSFHPLVPPERVVANVNLDMVGSLRGLCLRARSRFG